MSWSWLRRVDLLILDYGLRGSTAEDVVSALHGGLPVTVIVSANPRAQDLALRIGAPILRKPFDIDDLDQVVDRAMANHRET